MAEDAGMFSDAYNFVEPDQFYLHRDYIDDQKRIGKFAVRDSDIIIGSFPFSGSPWIEEMVWLLKNNFDYIGARTKSFNERIPTFELPSNIHQFWKVYVSELKDPRCITTNLPMSMLPKDIIANLTHPKIIHVYRHPVNVCKKYYECVRSINDPPTLPIYAELFMQGKVFMGPFWKHVLGYWEKRTEQDILFVKFEDMIRNLPSVINSVAQFLDVNVSEEQLPYLLSHLTEFRGTVLSAFDVTPSCSTTEPSTCAVITEQFDLWSHVKTNGTGFDWKGTL